MNGNQIIQPIVKVFKFHKKKILFFFGSISFGVLFLFPYDDLSDYVTQQVTQQTQSNVYLQFDGLSFGLMPQLGIKMENVLIETVYAPTLAVKTLGFAPKISSLAGAKAGKVVAYGIFDGEATVDFGPSNELDIDNDEMGMEIELENVELRELTQFLSDSKPLPVTLNGVTQLSSNIFVDPKFKKQPKGKIELEIKNLDIPSSTIPLRMGAAVMSIALPALKLSELKLEGTLDDGKLFIREGKIGEAKNDLHGTVTGDIFFQIEPGGRFKAAGYDLKVNLNISENLQRQLQLFLSVLDMHDGIGDKYKFKSLQGVRYSMGIRARDFQSAPQIKPY